MFLSAAISVEVYLTVAASHCDDTHIPSIMIYHHAGDLIYSVDVHLRDLVYRIEGFCMYSETLGEGNSIRKIWCYTT